MLHKAETPGAKMLVGLSSVELHLGQSQTLVREAAASPFQGISKMGSQDRETERPISDRKTDFDLHVLPVEHMNL